jgi:hypothetical protein
MVGDVYYDVYLDDQQYCWQGARQVIEDSRR